MTSQSNILKLGVVGAGVLGTIFIARDKKLSGEKKLKYTALTLGTTAAGVGAIGWYENYQAKKAVEQYEESVCQGVNLANKADAIYDAFWQYAFGTMEDEQRAVDELLGVPKSCVKQLAVIYNGKYGKNLYKDFTDYVQGDLYEKVRHLLN